MSHEADELRLYGDNTYAEYKAREPYLENMKRRMKKGTYDPAKGVKLWEYYAARVAKAYAKEWPGSRFTPAQRREAATVWERQARAELRGR